VGRMCTSSNPIKTLSTGIAARYRIVAPVTLGSRL
jgi:hypothetical protein